MEEIRQNAQFYVGPVLHSFHKIVLKPKGYRNGRALPEDGGRKPVFGAFHASGRSQGKNGELYYSHDSREEIGDTCTIFLFLAFGRREYGAPIALRGLYKFFYIGTFDVQIY